MRSALRYVGATIAVWVALLFIASVCAGAEADRFAPYRAVGEIRTGGVQGSGTLIATTKNKALVLSCRHVCRQVGAPVTVNWLWAGGQVSNGYVAYVMPGSDFRTDLAVCIVTKPRGITPRRVVRVKPADGPWVGAGFRGGQMHHFTADWYRIEHDRIETFDGAAVSGMSGGPFFNRRGEVVGVVVASDRKSKSISADGDWLHGMVRQYRRKN